MTKVLDEETMKSELTGSAFFKAPDQAASRNPATKIASNLATMPATQTPSNRDIMQSSSHDATGTTEEDLVELVRLALKELGREAGTHRYTPEEKKALEELVFEYHRRGVETSGNQIIRIGLNYLLEDYQRRKNDSILARVLERLNA